MLVNNSPSTSTPTPLGAATSGPHTQVFTLNNVSTVNGNTPTQEITLPANVTGLFIDAVSKDPKARVLIDTLEGPNGERLVSPSLPGHPWLEGPKTSPNRSTSVMSGATGFSAPNGDGVKLTPGRWTFHASVQDGDGQPIATSVDFKVYVRSGKLPTQGKLSLNLLFVTYNGRGLTAKAMRKSPEFAQIIDRVKQTFAEVGISIPKISFQSVELEPGSVREYPGLITMPTLDIDGLRGPTPGSLFQKYARQGALTVVFTEKVLVDDIVGGVTGGIPGPVSRGTEASGVVFSLSDVNLGDIVNNGATICHEIGHYLGLPHSEDGNGRLDSLADSVDGLSGPGSVMHYRQIMNGADRSFSPSQGQLMRLHPLVNG